MAICSFMTCICCTLHFLKNCICLREFFCTLIKTQYKDILNMFKSSGRMYLHPGLAEVEPHRELLPGEDVRVLRLLEGPLQLVQLVGGEGGPAPAHLPRLLPSGPLLVTS